MQELVSRAPRGMDPSGSHKDFQLESPPQTTPHPHHLMVGGGGSMTTGSDHQMVEYVGGAPPAASASKRSAEDECTMLVGGVRMLKHTCVACRKLRVSNPEGTRQFRQVR